MSRFMRFCLWWQGAAVGLQLAQGDVSTAIGLCVAYLAADVFTIRCERAMRPPALPRARVR